MSTMLGRRGSRPAPSAAWGPQRTAAVRADRIRRVRPVRGVFVMVTGNPQSGSRSVGSLLCPLLPRRGLVCMSLRRRQERSALGGDLGVTTAAHLPEDRGVPWIAGEIPELIRIDLHVVEELAGRLLVEVTRV